MITLLALIFSGLPTQPFTFAPSSDARAAGDAVAVWANSESASDTLDWSGSNIHIEGRVRSNHEVKVGGSDNTVVGPFEYVSSFDDGGDGNSFAPVRVEAEDFPVSFDLSDYAPGGDAAEVASPQYFDMTAVCESDGKFEVDAQGAALAAGLYFAPCDVVFNGSDLDATITVVSNGKIEVSGSDDTFMAPFVDSLLFFTTYNGDDAIKLSGSTSAYGGYLLAGEGMIEISGSDSQFTCGVLGDRIKLNGSNNTFSACSAPVDEAPIAADDAYSTDEDVPVVVAAPGVLNNDADADGDPLAAVLVDDVAEGTLILDADGGFTYTPAADFFGTDFFTYVANDGALDSNVATVSITVDAVNDPPVANPDGPYTGTEGIPVVFDGSGSFDLDGTIATFSWDFGDGDTGVGASPTHTYAAHGIYTVTLTVTDDGGLTDTASTSADIAAVPNSPPVALDDSYATDEDTLLEVAAPGVLDNDTDVDDDPLTAALVDDVVNGTLTLASDGSFAYSPDAGFFGDDAFTYVANDGTVDSNVAMVTISVGAVNDPPIADAGPDQTVVGGSPVSLDGTGSSDPDPGDVLTYSWVMTAQPTGAVAALSDHLTAFPTFVPDLPGDYVVTLTVDDGEGGTNSDSVVVTATPIGMAISLEDALVGVGRTTIGAIALESVAPPAGIVVSLSLETSIATVDPVGVPIPGGATEGTFVLTGVAVGTTTITGTSPATETATATVEVTDFLISIDDIPVLAPEESADLPVSITKPAPPGGLTISLESLDPSIAISDSTTFIPEGLFVPATNPEITGVDFGSTQIKATAVGFAPDVRDVTVALVVTLTPDELELPELWTLQVTAQLSAPAPSGGVTLDLSLDDPLATVAPTAFIPAGQTLSAPIDITGSTTLGTTTLRAGGAGLVEGIATIDVIDTPDVYVESLRYATGSYYYYDDPFVVGLDLQLDARVEFEVTPPAAVDVIVTVPPGSGVLLAGSPTEPGVESLMVDSALTKRWSAKFYIQGTVQGDDVDDDVPVTIDVFYTGTSDPVGYEQTEKPSNIDVGPSGFAFPTGNDLDAPTFPDTDVEMRAYLLYDTESSQTLHDRWRYQDVRGGHTVSVDVTSSNPVVGEVEAPVVFTGGEYKADVVFDGRTAGSTNITIAQPTVHTPPLDYLTRTVNVTAPDVYLAKHNGYNWAHEDPYLVGLDLQDVARVRLEVTPPAAVDVIVTVPVGSGVLISMEEGQAGSDGSVVVGTAVAGTLTPKFYIQGTVQGDDVDDDVPVTIDVFYTGTSDPVGYEQTEKPSNIDVGPSGFAFPTGSDLDTTTFSTNEPVWVTAYLLHDGESGTLHEDREAMQVRGGHTVVVDLTNSNPTAGEVVEPAVCVGGAPLLTYSHCGEAMFDPLTPGTTTLGIIQPLGHTDPVGRHLTRTVNVDAPDVYLQEYNGYSWVPRPDDNIGVDLQVERRIGLEVAPPAPGVDVTVEVIDPTVAVISADPTTLGTGSLTFPLVTGTSTPLIYLQGLAVDQGTEIRVTAPGYDQWITTVQVVDSGFYIRSPGSDFDTTVDAADSVIKVRAASLGSLQLVDEHQYVRGGATVTIDVVSSNAAVGVITVSPLVFIGGDDLLSTAFDPLAVGMTTISITQPPPFSAPAGDTSRIATVTAG